MTWHYHRLGTCQFSNFCSNMHISIHPTRQFTKKQVATSAKCRNPDEFEAWHPRYSAMIESLESRCKTALGASIMVDNPSAKIWSARAISHARKEIRVAPPSNYCHNLRASPRRITALPGSTIRVKCLVRRARRAGSCNAKTPANFDIAPWVLMCYSVGLPVRNAPLLIFRVTCALYALDREKVQLVLNRT